MRNIPPKLLIGIAAALHTLAGILSGSMGWDNQFLVVTIMGIVLTCFLYRKFNRNYKIILLVTLPFYIIYVPASIYLESYQTFPIWISGIISCLASYLLMRYMKSLPGRIVLLSLIPLSGYFFIMPNNFAWLYQESDLRPYKFDKISVETEAGDPVDLKAFNGKVVLLDIWHSACLPCIKKFPDLQALQDKYAGDSSVRIISLNIPLERDGGKKPARFTRPYSFTQMYFVNGKQGEQLASRGVPLILIFDKNFTCRYAGDLNIGWNVFTGNAKRIIDKLKSE